MCVTRPEELTQIYHFTHWDNLPEILEEGLRCKNKCDPIVDLSLKEVQDIRRQKKVSFSPYGTLHDYVPFYFGNRSPMINYIFANKKTEYYESVFIVVNADILGSDLVVFTDGNAASDKTNFFKERKDLDKVNLELATTWIKRPGDPETRRKANAEVLYFERVPVEMFKYIGVHDKNTIEEILTEQGITCPSNIVEENWYLDPHLYDEEDENNFSLEDFW